MSVRAKLSPRAQRDVESIHSRITAEDPSAADRVYDAALATADFLAQNPESGQRIAKCHRSSCGDALVRCYPFPKLPDFLSTIPQYRNGPPRSACCSRLDPLFSAFDPVVAEEHSFPKMTTKQSVANKIAAYLRHEITLGQLVDWSENTLLNEDFEEADAALLADVTGRLGLADVRAFGLTWEDCEEVLRKIGFASRVEVVATLITESGLSID